MKFRKLQKIHQGEYLTRYNLHYETKSGQPKQYEMISRRSDLQNEEDLCNSQPDAVVMIIHNPDGDKLLLNHEFRMAVGEWVYNFPAGLIDKGESVEVSAARELREETGIKAEELTEVGRVVSPENHSVYVEFVCETDCDKESVTLQEGETVDFCWVKRDILFNMGPDKLLTHRMQECLRKKSDEDMKNKDMTVPCDEGFINIRVGAIILKDNRFLMTGNKRQRQRGRPTAKRGNHSPVRYVRGRGRRHRKDGGRQARVCA